jgi:hypothetical protein
MKTSKIFLKKKTTKNKIQDYKTQHLLIKKQKINGVAGNLDTGASNSCGI